jgi:2-hydroxy-6-oxonona-2,4-dienedioate hydrolase
MQPPGNSQAEPAMAVMRGRARWIVLGTLLAGASILAGVYLRDMNRIRQRLAADSELVATRHGPIEVAVRGAGPAVLVLHGAGGGYDQARLIPTVFGGDGYRWIAVSRFGYLRSGLPADASTRAQAEAFADLLDALAIDRVAIVAMSGGVPPALQFAALFPDRTAGLVLLSSAPFTPLTAQVQELPMPAWLYQALFSSDLIFWLVINLAPQRLDPVFDITPALRADMTATDVAYAAGLLDAFLPVTQRMAGLQNEAAAIDPAARYDLRGVTAPTLVVHARDDGINPFGIGTYVATHIPGAEFMAIPAGGHLLLGHTEAVRARLMRFLGSHLAE